MTKLFQVQIMVTRNRPLEWQDVGGPVAEDEADKIIAYERWLDSRPPVQSHYAYRKVEVQDARVPS